MTKQEQIEDMAHIMCEYYNRGFCANGDMTEICEDMPDCCYKNYAEAVYDAGYRKADGVRKETAKEILSRIKLYATDSKTDLIDLIDEIANANGVEVEE